MINHIKKLIECYKNPEPILLDLGFQLKEESRKVYRHKDFALVVKREIITGQNQNRREKEVFDLVTASYPKYINYFPIIYWASENGEWQISEYIPYRINHYTSWNILYSKVTRNNFLDFLVGKMKLDFYDLHKFDSWRSTSPTSTLNFKLVDFGS